MKLLFDQNLSFKLCQALADLFPGSSQVRLLGLAEADDIASIMAATSAWDDVFSFTVVPACTAEQGLEMARQMMK